MVFGLAVAAVVLVVLANLVQLAENLIMAAAVAVAVVPPLVEVRAE
jgi:hypothetical protein